MKKSAMVFPALIILSIVSLGSFVSATAINFDSLHSSMSSAIDNVIALLQPFFEKIIGNYSGSEFFFGKVLLLILLVIIIKSVLEKTPLGESNRKVGFLIAVVVSILAIRFINDNSFFEAIFIQYSTLGIAITTILPMAIFFYFIHNLKIGTYGRKVFWVMYIITMVALWIIRTPTGGASNASKAVSWIYSLTILVALASLFFDRSIHAYFGLSHFKAFMKRENKEGIYRSQERLKQAQERFENRMMNEHEYDQVVRREEKLIRKFHKD